MRKSNQEMIIYNSDDGKSKVSLMTRDGDVWLNQSQLAELFDTSKQNIRFHVINILKERELYDESVVKEYLTTDKPTRISKYKKHKKNETTPIIYKRTILFNGCFRPNQL
jgi:hypothetical protein